MRVGVSGRLGSPAVGAWIVFKRVSELVACCIGDAAAHGIKLPVGLEINANQRGPALGRSGPADHPDGAQPPETLTTPVMPITQCDDAVVRIDARLAKRCVDKPCLCWKQFPKQFISLGEQYCESATQGGPLVTLWPLSAQVHRTVSPAEMLTVSGTNTSPPCPLPHRRSDRHQMARHSRPFARFDLKYWICGGSGRFSVASSATFVA